MLQKIIILIIFTCLALSSEAHTINYVLDKQTTDKIFSTYLELGFTHILPLGLDHVLFIVCVFFLNTSFKKILLQATMFTIAHSITLAMVVYDVINPPIAIIEAIIALSIAILAIENIFFNTLKPWRLIMIFAFGLIHGMGFASALDELGLPLNSFATALVSFNIGVELGQVSILVALFMVYKLLFEHKTWYRNRILIPSNIAIALIALTWTFQRLFQ